MASDRTPRGIVNVLTGAQLRAARALPGIDRRTLAGQAGVPCRRRGAWSRAQASSASSSACPAHPHGGGRCRRLCWARSCRGFKAFCPGHRPNRTVSYRKVSASPLPWMAHLSLAFVAGLYLPAALIAWFQKAAELLG
jgi:hypothetical protein